ncbi:leucine-rich repeat-containing protein 56 isoform X2 [Struthio camelus]|uniref:leucine-rich repeat-containing protein 56 isoform X2 n=2 Tax=Struthio camelus TaxID=8801 RepID=UPI003603C050
MKISIGGEMENERGRIRVPLEEKQIKMNLKWNSGRISRPASATIRVTDLSWRDNLNPSPLIKDDGELLMDEYLTPRKLKALAGVDDLQQVKALEMRVDTRENSLGNFGAYLPNLRELKLNNSLLASVRDLGTTLSHLHVLWMARCGLSDLDGISSCSSLKELYIAYNNISDLSQLSLLEHLEVLDLEGNNIEDINQMLYLGLCYKLSSLTVEGNLICLKPNAESAEGPDYNYRVEVKKLIPHLEYLDEIPASQTVIPPSKKMNKDWLIIKESIKEGGFAGDISWLDSYLGAVAKQPGSSPRPPTASRPGSAQWLAYAGQASNAHLLYGSCPLPDPTVSDGLFPEDDSSDLTYGFSQVICGNPIKALRARRQKLGPSAVSPLKLCSLRGEYSHASEEEGDLSQEDVFTELRVWREKHKRCLQVVQQEKSPQVLKATLSDEEEDEDCSLADNCEDELRKTYDEDLTERISLDSFRSCLSQSSSDSSRTQEWTVFSNPNRCLIPSPPKSPSPASVLGVAASPWKMRNHRVRHLKIPNREEDRQRTQLCQSRAGRETSAEPLGEELALLSLHSAPAVCEAFPSQSQGQHQPGGSTGRLRPISGPAAVGSTSVRPTMDKNAPRMISHHQPVVHSSTRTAGKFGLTNAAWPLTARAVLQKLPDRPSVSTTSQSKTPQS